MTTTPKEATSIHQLFNSNGLQYFKTIITAITIIEDVVINKKIDNLNINSLSISK